MDTSTPRRYLDAGLAVLPAVRTPEGKRPALATWREYQHRRPTEAEVNEWFGGAGDHDLCLVAGTVSGNLEVIDFDAGGELYEAWCAQVRDVAPELLDRLVAERTPSGGFHIFYRCAAGVEGSAKLAERRIECEGPDEILFHGKPHKPRKDRDGRWRATVTLIETRGHGGVCLCTPSSGYVLVRGDLEHIPQLSAEEREDLLACARAMNEVPAPVVDPHPKPDRRRAEGELRPGDDYNQRGNVRELLLAHGWALERPGENEHWRRPGKTRGTSATLKGGVFYVFSSNAAPFEPNRGYSLFAVYAQLEHHGDYPGAARELRSRGYGSTVRAASTDFGTGASVPCKPPEGADPIDVSLLTVPGFIGEVVDHSMATAPYPNRVLAFAGALALQALLAGRCVRDTADNRPNVYILGLAQSAAGKDWPRKVNAKVLLAAGLADRLADRMASGEGVQDALLANPEMLFQTDEIDSLLTSMTVVRDARYESLMSTLLTLHSSSSTLFPLRRRAGDEDRTSKFIESPCLVLFGTAIPSHFYSALSERMLTNGLIGRTLILESGKRGEGQEPRICDPPKRVLAVAKWWADRIRIADTSRRLTTMPSTDQAMTVFADVRRDTDARYSEASDRGEAAAATIWGRVNEHVRKLALLHAVSVSHRRPSIDRAGAEWARDLVMHLTRRMLHMVSRYSADTPFESMALRVIRKLEDHGADGATRSEVLRALKVDADTCERVTQTLIERGEIVCEERPTGGRSSRVYRLAAKKGERSGKEVGDKSPAGGSE